MKDRIEHAPSKSAVALGKIKPWQLFEYTEEGDKETPSSTHVCVALPDWSKGREAYSMEYLEMIGDGAQEGSAIKRYFLMKDPPDYIVEIKPRPDLRLKIIVESGSLKYRVETVQPVVKPETSDVKPVLKPRKKF